MHLDVCVHVCMHKCLPSLSLTFPITKHPNVKTSHGYSHGFCHLLGKTDQQHQRMSPVATFINYPVTSIMMITKEKVKCYKP